MSAPRVDVGGLSPGELVDQQVADQVASRLGLHLTDRAAGLRQVLAAAGGDR